MNAMWALFPPMARRRARQRAEHREMLVYLAALRRAGREQREDPDVMLMTRIYQDKVSARAVGRHRAA